MFSFYTIQSDKNLEYHNNFIADYGIYALNSPGIIDFCGEEMPLNDLNLKERLDKELLSNTYFQSNSLLYFKKANRWFPVIEPILKEYGIPNDFRFLPLIESNLSNVISPAGATGFWQLMKATAKQYGLEVNNEVDERYHVVLSTIAACKYLKTSYKEFNNWTLCAAAYNMGIDGLKRQLKKQKASNYYDLYLNTETSRYIFRLLAIKEILTNPKKYGYHFLDEHLYPTVQYTTFTVDTPIANIAAFAKSQNINYRILKIHNPWIRKNYLSNKTGRKYNILLPDSGYYVIDPPETETQSRLTMSDTILKATDSIKPLDNLDSIKEKK